MVTMPVPLFQEVSMTRLTVNVNVAVLFKILDSLPALPQTTDGLFALFLHL